MNETANNKTSRTRVDFYLLQGTNFQSILHFCCRLAEKAWGLGNTVYVRTEDEQQAQQLDNLMWTYSDSSFLPHARNNNSGEKNEAGENAAQKTGASIIIGSKIEHSTACDLMINLASDIPSSCDDYSRIAEILNDDKTVKTQGRIRYAQYDKKSYPLNHHNISV